MRKSKLSQYDSLPPEKTLALHNVTVLIKSAFDKDKSNTTIIYS